MRFFQCTAKFAKLINSFITTLQTLLIIIENEMFV